MKIKLIAAALASTAFAASPALAAHYVTGAVTYTQLGQQPGGDGVSDTVDFASKSGNITGLGVYDLNQVTLTVGFTGPNAFNSTGVFQDTIAIGGNSYTYDVNYVFDSYYQDVLTLGGNTANVGGFAVTINPLVLTGGFDGATFYSPAPGTLSATVTALPVAAIPEPATWAMMMLGFGMVGFGLRYRRKSQTAKISFA